MPDFVKVLYQKDIKIVLGHLDVARVCPDFGPLLYFWAQTNDDWLSKVFSEHETGRVHGLDLRGRWRPRSSLIWAIMWSFFISPSESI